MMQDRSAAAATWQYLANVDVNNGRYREAQSKYRMALAIQQEVGDSFGEAETFANLGALAAQLGPADVGLRLLIISTFLMREVEHPNLSQVEEAMYDLARRLRYSDDEMDEAVEEALEVYFTDGGWSLILEAFEDLYPSESV